MIPLSSKVSQKLLDLFFTHEDESFYVNELVRRLAVDKRNLVRKLAELEATGLFSVETRGNLKLYSLNKNFTLYSEYKKIILRTTGFDKKLELSLKKIKGIKRAFIFGSYAEDNMDAASDIDVFVVGDHSVIELQRQMAIFQKSYDREINLVSVSEKEFHAKKKDPFVSKVLKGKKIELI